MRNKLLLLSDLEKSKLNCSNYKNIDLQNICNSLKGEKKIEYVNLSSKVLLNKKVFNKRFDK
jgi:hypothetical protein